MCCDIEIWIGKVNAFELKILGSVTSQVLDVVTTFQTKSLHVLTLQQRSSWRPVA